MATSMIDAIEHMLWTVEKSPYAYAQMRDKCIELRIALVNAELRHQRNMETKNGNDRKASSGSR